MKTGLITLFSLLLVNKQLMAQVSVVNCKGTIVSIDTSKWLLASANISTKNTVNVGIGNLSPAYKLDVAGKARITDSLVVNTARVLSLSSGSSADSLIAADPNTGILKRIEQNKPVVIKTNTTQANSTTTLTTINTLSFNTIAGKNYIVRLWLVYNSAATGTGIKLAPNSFTGGNFWYNIMVNNSATGVQHTSGFNTINILNSTASAATTNNTAHVEMSIEATSVATVSFQFATEVAGSAITIQPNSRLEYQVTN